MHNKRLKISDLLFANIIIRKVKLFKYLYYKSERLLLSKEKHLILAYKDEYMDITFKNTVRLTGTSLWMRRSSIEGRKGNSFPLKHACNFCTFKMYDRVFTLAGYARVMQVVLEHFGDCSKNIILRIALQM